MSRRVLVCGGRNFSDHRSLYRILDQYHGEDPFSVLIHGAAPGADSLAGRWAKMNNVRVLKFPAEWTRYGNAAGPIRNSQMLRESQPELVIAFPGHIGTPDMIKKAKRAGVPVIEIAPWL